MGLVRCRQWGTDTYANPYKTVTVEDLDAVSEEVRDLLKGTGEGNAGLLRRNAHFMRDVMGSVELAFLRGVDVGRAEQRVADAKKVETEVMIKEEMPE